MAELECVYRAQFKAFLQTATAYLGDADMAKDAVQEGVANAIRNRGGYRGEGTLEAWVWKIVLNAIRSHHRERAHGLLLAEGVPALVSEAASQKGHEPDAVRAAVRRLPERQRLALFLRFYADMDYATIAELLDVSEGTVGASLNAARKTLRGLLAEVVA
ncbi:MAG TPA: sigma-70 family RNA polymerase sigma factor [Gaiellaceae bacterium]|nr:sigma-70 family RNA polymerase sigma factor [Gaiellaceae bacterium]